MSGSLAGRPAASRAAQPRDEERHGHPNHRGVRASEMPEHVQGIREPLGDDLPWHQDSGIHRGAAHQGNRQRHERRARADDETERGPRGNDQPGHDETGQDDP